MKFVVWVLVFVAYLLCATGIFMLMASATRGIEVEMNVEREVYGETVVSRQMVEFNEIPAVAMIFGMLGLYLGLGAGYITADYVSRAWVGDEEKKLTKPERLVKAGLFTVFFLAFSFIFGIHSIDRAFELMGILFMLSTCAATYFVSAGIITLMRGKDENAAAGNSEVQI